MVGLIWFVQVVHYPLFARVGEGQFTAYETAHQRLTTLVVLPPMITELVTGLLIAFAGDLDIEPWLGWCGLALLAVIWLSTFALQVPRHRQLQTGFDRRAHALLVATNWLRTAAWTARGALVLLMAGQGIA
jgi:hypothetical protein